MYKVGKEASEKYIRHYKTKPRSVQANYPSGIQGPVNCYPRRDCNWVLDPFIIGKTKITYIEPSL